MSLIRVAAITCILQLSACAGNPPIRTISLHMRGTGTPDATVTIDDQRIGPLASVRQRGVALPPGRHTVTVENPGFFPWDRVVVAPDDANAQPVFLDVQLQKIPD
ncbi:MAG: carboxypeptidase-like regulatory domain-containing protein [Polyangiaceae bacterium]